MALPAAEAMAYNGTRWEDHVYVFEQAHFLLGDLMATAREILWRTNFEEFCLLIIFFVPWMLATVAFFRKITGENLP